MHSLLHHAVHRGAPSVAWPTAKIQDTALSPYLGGRGGDGILLPTLHFPCASHFRERGRELCGGKRMIILGPEPVSASTAEATQRSRVFFLRSPFPLQPHSSTSSAFGPRRRRNIYCRVGLDCWLPFLVGFFSPPPFFSSKEISCQKKNRG